MVGNMFDRGTCVLRSISWFVNAPNSTYMVPAEQGMGNTQGDSKFLGVRVLPSISFRLSSGSPSGPFQRSRDLEMAIHSG
jgi:hypothetical protein